MIDNKSKTPNTNKKSFSTRVMSIVAGSRRPIEKVKHDTQVGYLIGTTCPPSGGLFTALCTVGGASIGTLRATAGILGQEKENHVKIEYYQDV